MSVIHDSCQSELYVFLMGMQQQQMKTETSVVIEQAETSELVQHKLAYFACLIYDVLLVETTGFIMPLID